jgi:cellulose synthase/poly-beta-1,6-N-acetylglucosamine synthase-like glycosyltransferase
MTVRLGPDASIARALVGTPAAVLGAVNLSIAGYLGVLALVGARRSEQSPAAGQATRFAILVPAHDEALVIADALRSFHDLDYPRGNYDVHVVADNCSDETAAIVRSHGWHAHERDDLEDPGKGPALNWLFDRIDPEIDVDVVVVVDADTVLDPGFLDAMDAVFAKGAQVAQGFYSVRDPAHSASAGIRYAALASRHHLRPLGRTRLGASCGLYGNGMAFHREILGRRRWSGHLVEDAEFQLELLLRDGICITYVPQARLEAEMPHTLDASTSQNERWERGRIELVSQYLPELLAHLVRGRSRRLATADAAIDLVVPPLSTVAVLQATGLAASALASVAPTGRAHPGRARRLVAMHLFTLAVLTAHVAVAMRSVGAPPSVWKSLLHAPKAIVWKSGLWARALRPKNSVAWKRTRRNSER